jgi:hypothetical protein
VSACKPKRWTARTCTGTCLACRGLGETGEGWADRYYPPKRCSMCHGEGDQVWQEVIEPRRRVYRVRGTGRVLGRFRGRR